MKKEDLIELKKKVLELSDAEKKKRDIYLRDIATDKILGPLTGYPEIDKPWLQFYGENVFDAKVPNISAYDFMFESNRDNLDNVALCYFENKFTYRELFNKIAEVENCFRNMGVKNGDIVTIAIPNIPENVFIFYALNKIGAVANFIDLRLKEDFLLDAINEVGSKILVGSDLFLKNIRKVIDQTDLEKVIVTTPSSSLPSIAKQIYNLSHITFKIHDDRFVYWNDFLKYNYPIANKEDKAGGEYSACILHTSGTSTGKSKGVLLSNYALNSMAMQYRYIGIDYKKEDRFMNQVPPFLAYNIILSTHMPLCMGMNIVMLPNYEPEKFAKHVMQYNINHVLAGPADWTNFLDNKKVKEADLSYLSTMGSGSDKINNEIKNKINNLIASRGGKNKILEGYGMTEVGSAACSSLRNVNVENSVGVPLPFMTIGIFDPDTLEELTYRSEGEICIKGPTMMDGYYNNQEATLNALRKHDDGSIWVHTGDLGRIDEKGVLYFMGRLKRLIIRYDGIKISPSDIENVVDEIPNVKDCCVVGIDDLEHNSGSVSCVNVVPDEENTLSDSELKDLIMKECNQKLTSKYSIKDINIMSEFPLTPVGKVDYRKLEKICNEKNKKILKKI